ncbi:MAG: hypothetical protein AVDCRST_MAG86-1001 [uncultured Truepera sp.]|uniref:LiaF transmembrane domain-containing protein n=1 Tax=uncultured Truepera sp. TaxID=543023 RepID=A0A6J4V0V7_9DEIN|nr:MAG: hypothetical protein AVDCRST_MAG86-1001 [uncultured Truepera sp.]
MTTSTRNQRLGVGLIVVGAVLLLGSLFGWNFGLALWPLFIFVPGVLLLLAAIGTAVSGLFIPGCVLTTLGLIFFVQEFTDHYESWAYAWALLPAAVGAGLFLHGRRSGNTELTGQGRRMAGIAATVFVVGAVFFEGFIFGDFTDTWFFRTGLPLFLIATGAFLLLRQGDGSKD